MRLVFDLTFCGDMASPTFAHACPEEAKLMTCEDYVRYHPESVAEAYWTIRNLDVYQPASLLAHQASRVEVVRRFEPVSGGPTVDSTTRTSGANGWLGYWTCVAFVLALFIAISTLSAAALRRSGECRGH